ncbi:MAG: toprim domain-containing protein, partial [Chloroflexi bacterium]|nr:toprim domain-containing protein [Chloroflexota bacterium]
PKYLNSPDSMLFHKSRTLYLLHRARRHIQKSNTVIVVEGYLDALMAHHYGIENVVATLGTAITPDHVQVLRRLARKVVFALDSDEAGMRAVERASTLFAAGEMVVQIASFPSGMDPDAFLRMYGPDGFREKLAAAVGVVEYRLASILRTADLQSEDGKRTAVQECTKVLAGVASPLLRDRYVDDLARLWTGAQAPTDQVLDQMEVVREEIARQVRAGLGPRSSRTAAHRLANAPSGKPQIETEQHQAESELLAALLARPSLLHHFADFLGADDFRSPSHREVYTLLRQHGPPEEWLSSLDDEETVRASARLLAQAETITDPETTATDCYRKVKDFEKRVRFEELRRKFTEMAAGGGVCVAPQESDEYYQLSRYFKPN